MLPRSKNGFTIIEVMIVLVIAAVILLIVFFAVPALQRSSRNTQRRSDINRLSGAMTEYVNRGGTFPGSTIGSNQALANDLANQANIQVFNKVEITTSAVSINDQPVSKETAQFRLNRVCNSDRNDVVTGSANSVDGRIALVYWLEPDAPHCLEVR